MGWWGGARRMACATAALAGALLVPSDARAGLEDATPDHDAVLFLTTDRLVPEDVDQHVNDLYLRRGDDLTLVSTSPTDRHDSRAAQHGDFVSDSDSHRISILTSQRLVPEDTDEEPDTYLWRGGEVSLIADSIPYRDVANDIRAVGHDAWLIGTDEPLLATDTDGVQDIYRVEREDIELVSRGAELPVHLGGSQAISRDGRRVAVLTESRLAPEDEDDWADLYLVGGAEPELVSTSVDPDRYRFPSVLGISPDGSSLIWFTSDRATAEDRDRLNDVYAWRAGRNQIASSSPLESETGAATVISLPQWVSEDAQTVFFVTRSRLTADDPDHYVDVYRWRGGLLELVTPRDREGVPSEASAVTTSADGTAVVIGTERRLTASDTESETDLYRWRDGELSLITEPADGAPPPDLDAPPRFSAQKMSSDGSAVVFGSDEALDPGDVDPATDLYLWTPSALELITRGGEPPPEDENARTRDPLSVRMSRSGSVLFDTSRRLLPADRTEDYDTYRYFDGKLELVSGGGNISEPEPDTKVVSGPPTHTTQTLPSFRFEGSRPGLKFECRVNTSYWLSCADDGAGWQPHEPLREWSYTFEVRAVGWDRVPDSTPATYRFTVDRTPPELKIDAGPDGATSDRKPTFWFTARDQRAMTYECSIDRGREEYGPCTWPQSHVADRRLGDGAWRFRVRATDQAGNTTTRTRSFQIDATGPVVRLVDAPQAVVDVEERADVSFRFEADEPGVTYSCMLSRRLIDSSCSSPAEYRNLRPREYTFRLRAYDELGNPGRMIRYPFTVRARP